MYKKVITWLALAGAALQSVLGLLPLDTRTVIVNNTLLKVDQYWILANHWQDLGTAAKVEWFLSFPWLFIGLTMFLVARVWELERRPVIHILGFALLLIAVADAWIRAQTAQIFRATAWSLNGPILLLEASHLVWASLILVSLAASLYAAGSAAKVLAVFAGGIGVVRVFLGIISNGVFPGDGPQSVAIAVSLLISLWLLTSPISRERSKFRS